jgi:hypothetical protein
MLRFDFFITPFHVSRYEKNKEDVSRDEKSIVEHFFTPISLQGMMS